MAKFLKVRGQNATRLLLGKSGLHLPRRAGADDSQAIKDANDAVARLDPTSTEHVKDTIWQWVYNASLDGTWRHIDRVVVPRTNEASAYTCLKTGVVSAPTGSPVYVPQDGLRLPPNTYVNLNYNISSKYVGPDDFVIGTMISGGAGAVSSPYIVSAGEPVSGTVLQYNAATGFYAGGLMVGAGPAFVPNVSAADNFGKLLISYVKT